MMKALPAECLDAAVARAFAAAWAAKEQAPSLHSAVALPDAGAGGTAGIVCLTRPPPPAMTIHGPGPYPGLGQ
jgi:hypothetical protein